MSCNLLMENLKDSSVHAQQTILIQRYNKMVANEVGEWPNVDYI